MPTLDRNGYRLQPDDQHAIETRIREKLTELAACRFCQGPTEADRHDIARAAYWSIGCNVHDLRECELAWIHERITDLLAET